MNDRVGSYVLLSLFALFLCIVPKAVGQSDTVRKHSTAPKTAVGRHTDAPITLGDLRKQYLGAKVIVTGTLYQQQYLLRWDTGDKVDNGRYRADYKHLASSYKEKEARVIALQKDDFHERIAGKQDSDVSVNALGEPVSDDSTVNPYTNVVVQFDDGTIAIATTYPSDFSSLFKLASVRKSHAEMIEANLKSIVGRRLYATALSDIFEPSISFEDLIDSSKRAGKRITKVPFLVPLPIINAKYFREHDVVVFKVQFPDGRYGLIASQYRDENWGGTSDTFLGRVAGFLLPEIPRKLTPNEVTAIKQKTIFKGMSQNALSYCLGVTLKENNWGLGGKQLIYADTVYVYLDRAGKVSDWQVIEH